MIRSKPTIGFFVSRLDYEYQRMIWKGIKDTAKEQDAHLICFPGEGINRKEGYEDKANIIYSFAGPDCLDGIVMLTNTIGNYICEEELLRFCSSYSPIPVVSIGLNLQGIKSIITDNNSGMEELIRHLITIHDCRNIALITGPEGHQEAEQRCSTFLKMCESFGIRPDPDFIVRGNFQKSSGKRAVSELFGSHPSSDTERSKKRTKPDAIVASNDSMALGAIEELLRLGFRVPEDIIVAGFDDILESEYFTPPLTTVHQPVTEIGTVAIHRILDMIRGSDDLSLTVLPTRLVVRQSCGCLPLSVPLRQPVEAGGRIPGFPGNSSGWQKQIIKACSMINYVDRHEVSAPFARQLKYCLEAFHADLVGEKRDRFLPVLNGILREWVLSGLGVSVWYEVIEAIRHVTGEYLLAGETSIRAEGIYEKARALLAETTVRLHEHRRMKTEHWTSRLKEIGNMLITTFDITRLLAVIEYALVELGVRLAFCLRYSDEFLASKSRILFAFDGKKMTDISSLDADFSSSSLLHSGFEIFDVRRTMIMEPLYFQDAQLGYLFCDAELDEPLIYDTLRQQISSALKGASLVEEIKRHAETLEDEVANRTQELLAVNMMLEDEIKLRQKVEENLIASEQNLRSITEAIPIPLVIIQPASGGIHYANSPFTDAFGIKDAGRTKLSIFDFFSHEDLAPIIAKVKELSELSHVELQAKKADESLFWVISSFRRMVFRQEDAILAGFYDLTERRRLEQEILEVSGNERRRIGQELHDDICQHMVGMAAIGQVIENQMRQTDPQGAKKAAYLNQLIHSTLIKTKALSEGLYPAGLERSGLFIMLRQLAKNVEMQFNIACAASANDGEAEYDDIVSLNLYRIAQEAVNNAVRHGSPDTIEIALSTAGGVTSLSVTDNGVGVPPDFERSLGLGIKSMRYRANMIGGKFEIRRNGERGTIVSCSVVSRPK